MSCKQHGGACVLLEISVGFFSPCDRAGTAPADESSSTAFGVYSPTGLTDVELGVSKVDMGGKDHTPLYQRPHIRDCDMQRQKSCPRPSLWHCRAKLSPHVSHDLLKSDPLLSLRRLPVLKKHCFLEGIGGDTHPAALCQACPTQAGGVFR